MNNQTMNSNKVNRKHKDSLFRLIFGNKEDLLDLYNALNGTDYTDPADLTYYTLEDAIYINIKNDVSFLISDTLNLYEHQSTQNPNMPIRGLIYLSKNYQTYIKLNHLDIHSSVLQKLPLPQYYVFYNGTDQEPDKKVLELTDAFPEIPDKEPCLNCKATLLNINYGHNKELLRKCRKLEQYSIFIDRIRKKQKSGFDLPDAVDQAIDDCINDNVLKEFLIKCRTEVQEVVLSTFDQENHDRILKEDSLEKGKKLGKELGEKIGETRGKELLNLLNQKLVSDQRIDDLVRATTDPEFQKKLLEEYNIN
jgi:hypothetical protein